MECCLPVIWDDIRTQFIHSLYIYFILYERYFCLDGVVFSRLVLSPGEGLDYVLESCAIVRSSSWGLVQFVGSCVICVVLFKFRASISRPSACCRRSAVRRYVMA